MTLYRRLLACRARPVLPRLSGCYYCPARSLCDRLAAAVKPPKAKA